MGFWDKLLELCKLPDDDDLFDEKQRFITIYHYASMGTETKILQDTLTGVQYLYYSGSKGAGLTPLIDQAGHPIVTPVFREEDF